MNLPRRAVILVVAGWSLLTGVAVSALFAAEPPPAQRVDSSPTTLTLSR